MSRRLTPTVAQLATDPSGGRSARSAWTPRRALATLGAAGPVAFLLISVLAGLIKPGYDIGEQTVSDLAVGAHGWLQTANFLVLGATMIALAFALRAAPCRRSPSAVALLAAAGAGVVAAAFFPTDLAGAPVTSDGVIHNMLFLGIFLALIAAFALQGRALRRGGAGRALVHYFTLTAAGVFALLVCFVMFAGDIGDPLHGIAGLLERVLIAAALAPITLIGRRLLSR